MTTTPKRGSAAKIPRDLKAAILKEMAHHVLVHGGSDYNLLRERPEFSHVIGRASGIAGKQRFWRWLRAVRKPTPPDKTRPYETRSAAADALKSATERARVCAERNLPAAPSPAYMMRAGAQATKNIDFLAAVSGIWSDAKLLRAHAMVTDDTADGGERIDNPGMLDASIKRRLEVVESALRVMREIWDLKYQQSFYDGITSIVVDELAVVPEIQERVCRKLAELNNNLGMTIHTEAP